MKRLLATVSFVAAFAVVGPVCAREQGNPAFATPGTQSASGMPASNEANVTDRNFARAAAAGGLSEVELGRLADQKGQSSEARAFGQRMANDHSKANNQLKELGAAANIPLPDAPSSDDQKVREQLDQTQRNAFDRDYIISEARSLLTSRRCSYSNMRSARAGFPAEKLCLSDAACPDAAS